MTERRKNYQPIKNCLSNIESAISSIKQISDLDIGIYENIVYIQENMKEINDLLNTGVPDDEK